MIALYEKQIELIKNRLISKHKQELNQTEAQINLISSHILSKHA